MVRNQSGSTERPNNLSFSDVFVIKELSNKFNRNQQRARNVYPVIFTTCLFIDSEVDLRWNSGTSALVSAPRAL